MLRQIQHLAQSLHGLVWVPIPFKLYQVTSEYGTGWSQQGREGWLVRETTWDADTGVLLNYVILLPDHLSIRLVYQCTGHVHIRHDSDMIVHFKKTQGKSFVWITYLYLNFRYWNFSRRRKSWLPKYCCIGISKFSFRERLC